MLWKVRLTDKHHFILLNIGACPVLPFPSLPLVTNFASPMGIEIKTKWLSQAACRHHKLRNFCARLNHFLGVYRKKWRLPYSSFFRVIRRGVLCFFCRCTFHGENCEIKSPFSAFFKKVKTGGFVLWFSPWKMHRQKKQSTPWRRARKNE